MAALRALLAAVVIALVLLVLEVVVGLILVEYDALFHYQFSPLRSPSSTVTCRFPLSLATVRSVSSPGL